MRSARRGNENPLDRGEILPEIARVSRVDGIALAAFDRGCDRLATDGCFDDVVHVFHRQAVARGCFTVHGEIEEIPTGCSLGKNRTCVAKSD